MRFHVPRGIIMNENGNEAIKAINLVKVYKSRERGLVRRKFREIKALRGLSFNVKWGEIYGLLGPNGAGKTTLVKILSTLLLPDSGKAFISGFDVVAQANEVKKRIGVMLSVERGFFWKLTAKENLKYFGMLYGIKKDDLDKRIEEVLDIVGLKDLNATDRRFEDMSLGMKARLGLARALLKDPEVLILDEPTLGLDPSSSRTIRSLLKKEAGRGKAVLLTTHNMFEAEIVCDRVGIIYNGRIVVEGTPNELKRKVSGKVGIVLKLRGSLDAIHRIEDNVTKRLNVGILVQESDGEGSLVRIVTEPESIEKVVNFVLNEVVNKNLRIVEWKVEEPTLEDVFIEVTKNERKREL